MENSGTGIRRWTTATVHTDVWADPGEDPRADGGTAVTDERGALLDALRRWKEEAGATDACLAAAPDLGARTQLRELPTLQITEYARRCGHADLLRERVDGRVGQ